MLSFPRRYSPNLWVAPILFFFFTITRHSLLLSQFLCTSSCIAHVRIPFTTSWICSLLFQIQILGHTPLESIQLRYISFLYARKCTGNSCPGISISLNEDSYLSPTLLLNILNSHMWDCIQEANSSSHLDELFISLFGIYSVSASRFMNGYLQFRLSYLFFSRCKRMNG